MATRDDKDVNRPKLRVLNNVREADQPADRASSEQDKNVEALLLGFLRALAREQREEHA